MLALLRDSPNADYYIWPEATGTYHLNRSPEAVQAIKKALPVGAMAIIGADRSTGQNKENYQAWNSMYVISAEGIHAVYDKQHLVPFGEYVPLSAILPLENITGGMVDFSSGIGEKRLRTEGLNAIPLICYEIIFTDYAFYSGARPDFIINITNDAWFGNSIGPYQHLAMAQMRAIESGLPVLRAAKTGVSAVVDSFGVVQSELGLNLSGIVFTDIPDKVKAKTIYGKYGLSLILLIMLSSSIIVFFLRKK
jgi:apolipoprotein N-acyltransferase